MCAGVVQGDGGCCISLTCNEDGEGCVGQTRRRAPGAFTARPSMSASCSLLCPAAARPGHDMTVSFATEAVRCGTSPAPHAVVFGAISRVRPLYCPAQSGSFSSEYLSTYLDDESPAPQKTLPQVTAPGYDHDRC